MSDLKYIALSGVILLYWIVKFFIKKVRQQRFRKKPHDTPFSGGTTDVPEYVSRAEAIGDRGEKRVAHLLENLLPEDYQVFNDLLIRKGNYTTQIDHVILSRYGVFVLETKNIHGKVYGSGNSEYWKQYLPDTGYRRYGRTQEHLLRNPIWQNDGHIRSLRRHVFGQNLPIHGIVVFSDDTDLFVTAEVPVLKMSEIIPHIMTYQNEVLSSDKIDFYRRRLFDVVSTSDLDRKEHIANVHRHQERRDAAVAEGKCPRCGGNLVLRSGKYGPFYGCSNYPECNYILNK